MKTGFKFVALAALVLASTAFSAEDAEGAKDHPEIPRFPGFYISDGRFADFDAHEFQLAADPTTGDERAQNVEGRKWSITYTIKEGSKAPSPLQLVRNYEAAIKKKGGQMLNKWNGDFRSTFKMPLGKSERWIDLNVFNDGEIYELIIVEVAEMKQEIELSASEMMAELEKNGFVSLYGVTFDTGKDTIKADSEALLNEIVTLLKDNASLKLSVEGHTDNVGDAKANLALSKRRSESVKKWLSSKGVEAKRLAANGFGDTKPVADNRTEEGRAKNRRVELVKQK